MKVKNWLFATSVAMVVVLVGCNPSTSAPQGNGIADSLIVATLDSRLDSLQAALDDVKSQQSEMTKSIALLEDTLLSLAVKTHKNQSPDVGGEARGEPIRRDNAVKGGGK
jgi:hypothetical protein